MWGTQFFRILDKPFLRFIPTHVGNSTFAESKYRECAGSSPRMWGTLNSPILKNIFFRFIPTHVGNSPVINENINIITVHPHACGELWSSYSYEESIPGSSPRMWGTQTYISNLRIISRFIPTHVGNSRATRSHFRGISVHPHACGELRHITVVGAVIYGSSPRMWGTPSVNLAARIYHGSSPRMWGTLHHPAPMRFAFRFIPTHVGNSFHMTRLLRSISVHPHACGELHR